MIQREAVLHIPLSQYAFAEGVGCLTIRLRAALGNLKSCTLFYGDRAIAGPKASTKPIQMTVIASDDLHDYWEAQICADFDRVYYYFKLQSDNESLYYYADFFSSDLPFQTVNGDVSPAISEYYQYPVTLRTELSTVPEWLKSMVMYQIFPDSFATEKEALHKKTKAIALPDGHVSRSLLGGTLNGIFQNLDYIQSLGANCLYLNPIFVAKAYHKYDTLDYFHIDPCMGTEGDFDALVAEIHRRGMHILLDGVFNHCSSDFFAFADVIKNGPDSPYADWFYQVQYPVCVPKSSEEEPNYACFAYVGEMPKLNTANAEVQAYFAKVGRYWVEERHIDGWRLDVANEVTKDFWRLYRKEIHAANPEAVLIGEVWENAETWLRGDTLDSAMNYDFLRHCRDFFANGSINAQGFHHRVTNMLMRYPTQLVRGQMNLLDSHDVPRFLTLCGGDKRKHRLAVLFQALCPGAPSIYYGDEQAMTGATEAQYRAPMPWGSRDAEYEGFFREALTLRKLPVCINGDFCPVPTEKGSRLYAFSRSDHSTCITAYLNAESETVKIDTQADAEILLVNGFSDGKLDGYGYLVVKKSVS